MFEFNEKAFQAQHLVALSEKRRQLYPAVEILAIFTAMLGFGYLVTGTFGFANAPIHPYWIAVVLVAAQYGLNWGLASALTASALHFAEKLGEVSFVRMPFETLEHAGALTAVWLIAAVLVGSFRDRAESRLQESETARRQAEADHALLEAKFGSLMRENEVLHARLARGKADHLFPDRVDTRDLAS